MKKKFLAVFLATGIVFSFSSAALAAGPPKLCNGDFSKHPCIW